MERSFLTTEIDECCLGNSVDDKRNTIYGYFVAERSGSNDLRYHPAESRTLTPVNQTQPNHSPATASKNGANFLTELTPSFVRWLLINVSASPTVSAFGKSENS